MKLLAGLGDDFECPIGRIWLHVDSNCEIRRGKNECTGETAIVKGSFALMDTADERNNADART